MRAARHLYDEDFVAWTAQQTEALRAASRGSSNQQLDWENLAEEIESLGKSDRRELRSQIYRIILHLAKLQFSPASDPRRRWRESVRDARRQAELVLADSPSLRPHIKPFITEETTGAIRRALADLEEYGEGDPDVGRALRGARYNVDEVLGDWFPPDRARPASSQG